MFYYINKICIIFALISGVTSNSNEPEVEVKYVDIVTFIKQLSPDLENTINSVLEINESIPIDIRHEDSNLQLLMINELEDIESIMLISFHEHLLDLNAEECILNSYQLAIDTEMFKDEDLQRLCEGEKYHHLLSSIYSDLIKMRDAAINMPSEFIKANMWCSNNFDTAECYEKARMQVIQRSSLIVSAMERAEKVEFKVVEDYNKTEKECLDGAVKQLDDIDKYLKDTIQNCMLPET